MAQQTKLLYEFNPFHVDARERLLLRDGEVVPLTPKVFDILLVLVQNSGHILGKEEMMKQVWPDAMVEEANLTRNISTLRKALGENAGAPQYIETIPWRGYRFVASVREVCSASTYFTTRGTAIDSIAVLPFVNASADPDAEYLSDGITDGLINNLSQLTHLKVMSRHSVFRYKTQSGNLPDAQAVGRELSVKAVLTGRVAQRGEDLLVSVELVDAQDNRHLWGEQYNRKLTDLFTTQEAIAREISERLRLSLSGEEKQRLAKRYTNSPEAYQFYLKGRYHWGKLTPDDMPKGIEYFQQAIDQDPRYGLAYAGLADCYAYFGNAAEAKKAATKALELDETLGEAHAALGFFKFLYDWDFPGAEKEFKRALELNPNFAVAHHQYAIYLANMGRHDESIREAKRAQELDPLSLMMSLTPGLAFYLARKYDQAIEEEQKVIEMDANFIAAHTNLGLAYEQQGLHEQAIAEYQKVSNLIGDNPTAKILIAHVETARGRRSEAEKVLHELLRQPDPAPYSYFIATLYTGLGNKERAFEWLNKAYEKHDGQMVMLKVDPNLDSLRADPRFDDLLRRIGLMHDS